MSGFCGVGLDNAKTPANVGSALRACGVFGAEFLAISGARYVRSPTDTAKAYRSMPLFRCQNLFDLVPFDCVPVAIEITDNAKPLPEYQHPDRAFYIFGAEDQTLGARILSGVRDVVFIPSKSCLNLAACVNVVLYDRMVKRGESFATRGMSERERMAA